ncbi:major capsid protein [uncultured Hyphomicrobium sp.]|uniref:major capsid protein n=1 Tax=uncultured Hyphomicrobium sp. TaxID=194373 RepID=UPI0025EEC6B7|nr:major capsid protein [uncultured Hyphomicrobium sp.]
MNAGQLNRYSSYTQDGVVETIEPLFSWLVPMFFGTVKTFETEFVEFDIVEGGRRIAPFVSPLAQGASTRDVGYRTYQLKPAYIKLLDTVRPESGFVRLPGEAYGGSISPAERLARSVAAKIALHREMIETRWEAMAAEVLLTGKLTIKDMDYPRAVVDFERDPNLTIEVGTVWSNTGAATPLDDIVALADAINTASKGAVANNLVMRTKTWDSLMKNTAVRDLVNRDKNLSPSTRGLEFGPRSSDKKPVFRGILSGQYEIWTYDGYYEDDNGLAKPFIPEGRVIMSDSAGIEGVRYHGAIFDMEAGLAPIEIFQKSRELWNPSGQEVLTQSAPMLGVRRPNRSGVLIVG